MKPRNEEGFDDIMRTGHYRMDLVGRRVDGVRFERGWTILELDNGQQVHILDESPWVWVDPEVM